MTVSGVLLLAVCSGGDEQELDFRIEADLHEKCQKIPGCT